MSDSSVTIRPRESDVAERASAFSPIRMPSGPLAPFDAEQEPDALIAQPVAAARRRPGDASRLDVGLQIYGDLADVAQEWKIFETHADCTAFQTFGWLAAWQRHIGARNGSVPAIVMGRDTDGDVLFILPLAIATRGSLRRLTWLGSELCDYNAPLLAARFGQHAAYDQFVPLWGDIIDRLRADPRFRFDLVDLQKMPELVGAQRNPFLKLKTLANPSGAYVATLGDDWEAFYAAKRSSSTRKRERRQRKHLAEFGEVRFVDVQDRRDSERTLETLIGQKTLSFASMGVENLFARPGYREFYLDIATDSGLRNLIHVSRLDVGATIAATNLGLRFRNCYYLALSSYHDGELSRFGPGRAHLHELLRHAIDRGFHWFDFTIGDEPYKLDWSDNKLRLHDHLAAVTVRGWPIVLAAAVLRRTTRFIKQTPALWRAFSKARALAGSIQRQVMGPRLPRSDAVGTMMTSVQ